MLDRIDLDVTVDQRRRHGCLADVGRTRRDFDHRVEVGAAEDDAGVNRCRLEGQVNLLPGVQTDTCGTDGILQGALFNHGIGRFSANCEQVSTKAGDDNRPNL
ncbi:hypothetical protein D3C81_1300270 [compost metagenome]